MKYIFLILITIITHFTYGRDVVSSDVELEDECYLIYFTIEDISENPFVITFTRAQFNLNSTFHVEPSCIKISTLDGNFNRDLEFRSFNPNQDFNVIFFGKCIRYSIISKNRILESLDKINNKYKISVLVNVKTIGNGKLIESGAVNIATFFVDSKGNLLEPNVP